jgi:hypothetical protein
VIVTEPFDFVEASLREQFCLSDLITVIKTPKPLIQTFAALGFSALTELGYDWECERIIQMPRNLVDFENGKFLIKNGLSKCGAYYIKKHGILSLEVSTILVLNIMSQYSKPESSPGNPSVRS